MSSADFITQVATKEIFLRVTNVCGECYDNFCKGDTIYYDMQNFRYLCQSCHEAVWGQIHENCESEEDEESPGLFC